MTLSLFDSEFDLSSRSRTCRRSPTQSMTSNKAGQRVGQPPPRAHGGVPKPIRAEHSLKHSQRRSEQALRNTSPGVPAASGALTPCTTHQRGSTHTAETALISRSLSPVAPSRGARIHRGTSACSLNQRDLTPDCPSKAASVQTEVATPVVRRHSTGERTPLVAHTPEMRRQHSTAASVASSSAAPSPAATPSARRNGSTSPCPRASSVDDYFFLGCAGSTGLHAQDSSLLGCQSGFRRQVPDARNRQDNLESLIKNPLFQDESTPQGGVAWSHSERRHSPTARNYQDKMFQDDGVPYGAGWGHAQRRHAPEAEGKYFGQPLSCYTLGCGRRHLSASPLRGRDPARAESRHLRGKEHMVVGAACRPAVSPSPGSVRCRSHSPTFDGAQVATLLSPLHSHSPPINQTLHQDSATKACRGPSPRGVGDSDVVSGAPISPVNHEPTFGVASGAITAKGFGYTCPLRRANEHSAKPDSFHGSTWRNNLSPRVKPLKRRGQECVPTENVFGPHLTEAAPAPDLWHSVPRGSKRDVIPDILHEMDKNDPGFRTRATAPTSVRGAKSLSPPPLAPKIRSRGTDATSRSQNWPGSVDTLKQLQSYTQIPGVTPEQTAWLAYLHSPLTPRMTKADIMADFGPATPVKGSPLLSATTCTTHCSSTTAQVPLPTYFPWQPIHANVPKDEKHDSSGRSLSPPVARNLRFML